MNLFSSPVPAAAQAGRGVRPSGARLAGGRGRQPRRSGRAGERVPRAGIRIQVSLPAGLIAAITLAGSFAPVAIHLSPLLVAAPTSTAAFARARFTACVALVASAAMLVVDRHDGLLHSSILPIHIGALLAVSGFVIAARTLHDRDLRELHEVRAVSEAAQRVLLRPIPERMGPLRVASVYRAAAAHALVGGDLFGATRTDHATRFLIGDVRGKGLPAVEDASVLLGAFREAAHHHTTLPALAASLELSVERHLAQLTEADPEAGERFITALLVEVPDDAGIVRVVSCGHPPPLLRHRGRVMALEARRPAPPFGLAGDTPDDYHLDVFVFGSGDTLLLYTDGAIEARNASGDFYPLQERAATWDWEGPGELLRHVGDDLDAHTGQRLDDDLAMVAVQRPPVPGVGQGPPPPRSPHPAEAAP
ncbi:serine/threonine-protein phosphatase [Actinacidiphila glaucinigra]|uniref:PP2C family protein-serine/threonine phosphatase n=1 Tax=Actinacidiphila glaucinigra TaxID=235986 RepID=UPI002DD935A8|nr:PP2C family protein-serine/threonine phosphatase [Actinacidiphila glaucinigra]WSD64426.1 serine/threonine-protein phosphatase [Actinacidiphila glaucinigra]